MSRSVHSSVHSTVELVLAAHELARDISTGSMCRVDVHKQYGQRLVITKKKSTCVWYCKKNKILRAVTKQGVQSVNVVAQDCKKFTATVLHDRLVSYALEGSRYEHLYFTGYAVCYNGIII